jgi:hypothetical protein
MGETGVGVISNVDSVGRHWLRDEKGIVKQRSRKKALARQGCYRHRRVYRTDRAKWIQGRPRCHPKTSPERIINQTAVGTTWPEPHAVPEFGPMASQGDSEIGQDHAPGCLLLRPARPVGVAPPSNLVQPGSWAPLE